MLSSFEDSVDRIEPGIMRDLSSKLLKNIPQAPPFPELEKEFTAKYLLQLYTVHTLQFI